MTLNIVQHRRGSLASWEKQNIVPEDGEIIIVEMPDGAKKLKLGDGKNNFKALPYLDKSTTDKLKQLTTILTKANESIKNLNETNSAHWEMIEALQLGIESVRQTVSDTKEIERTGLKNAKDIGTINGQITALNNKAALLDKADNALKERINTTQSALSRDIASIRDGLTEMNTKRAEDKQVVNDLAQTVDNLAKELRTADGNLASVFNEVINQINREIEDLVDDEVLLTNEVYKIYNTLVSEFNDMKKKIADGTIEVKDTWTDDILMSEQRLTEEVNAAKDLLNARATELDTAINAVKSTLKANLEAFKAKTTLELQSLSKQVNELIALPEGSTTGDAELVNIRTSFDGTIYDSAGDAVRAIGEELYDLKESLPSYIPDNAVDGLLYENNLLYLTSNGEPVSEPIEITGGGGGGSSGGSVIKLVNENGSTNLTFAVGTKAELRFFYDSLENGVSTGAGTCTVQVGSKVVKTFNINPGSVKVDVAEFVKAGSNKVKVTCTDQYGVYRSLTYTVSIIDLRITSTFDDTADFTGDITFKYTPFGAIDKKVHILVDGTEVLAQDTKASGKQSTIVIPKQSHGSHVISVYLSATLDTSEIFSNTLVYEVICLEEGKIEPVMSSIYTEAEKTQGDLVAIPFRVYDPTNTSSDVDLIVYSITGGQEIVYSTTKLTVDRTEQLWNIRNYPIGKVRFAISYTYDNYGETKTIVKSHDVNVTKLDIDVEAETNDLQLYLTAAGRSNNEQDPATWTFGKYSTTFQGFNWKSNGWLPDASGDVCLRLNGGANVTVNIKPFEEDFKVYGKTLEFDFVVRDVTNRDTEVIKCFQDGRGFVATADTAFLKSSGTYVSCNYKDEERIRVAITVESTLDGTNFVSMYVNGVLSSCQRYANTDNFSQNKPAFLSIGAAGCDIDLYNVRIYTTALPASQVLENRIADISEPTKKLELFADNDIYDENTGLVSYEKVKDKIPVVTFIGEMPKFKGDKKKNSVYMKFEHPEHPELNFEELLAQIDVQGTSSQYYVRKNWKTKHNEPHVHMPGAIPAKVFCLKVDYAEATGTHNTQSANFVETLYDKNVSLLPAQDIKTYGDATLPETDPNHGTADERVRTTITGFPCVIFEKETEDSVPVFSAKANFNYDKDAENAFGFTDDFEVESWEFCNNTSAACNFLGEIENPDNVESWITDFEPRYAQNKLYDADGKEVEYDGDPAYSIERFKEMHDWVCSTATYTVGTTAAPVEAEARLWQFNNEVSNLSSTEDESGKVVYPTLNNGEPVYWHFNGEATEHLVTYDRDGKVVLPGVRTVADGQIWQLNNTDTSFEVVYDEEDNPTNVPTVDSAATWYLNGVQTKYAVQTDSDGMLMLPVLGELKAYWLVEGELTTAEVIKDESGNITNKPVLSDRGTWVVDGVDTGKTATSRTYLPAEEVEARRAKFRAEFENYFDLHYSLIYYVFTFFALMTDQRAKNMFLTYWGATNKWYPYFYDNDTSFGINNEGARVFDYSTEDSDLLDGANVYNGQNSVLWDNFKVCFANEIKETYTDLRNNNKLTYDKLVDQYITKGSDCWSAAIYNEDAEYKYITMARPDAEGKVDTSNLYQIKGTAEQHFKYFVDNRIKYCDSKWAAGDYPQDLIFLRIYTPQTEVAVPASSNITVVPFSDMYAGVKYKANGTMLQQRLKKNERYEFTPPKQADGKDEVFNDTETSIYGASEISSLGDLSRLYLGVINVSAADKLTELIIGNHTEGYRNDNFREIAVGSNRLLRKIDLTNCQGLGRAGENPQTSLDLSNCNNIEEILVEGTSLQSVVLPESGHVKTLHLPDTLTSLVIKNQNFIKDLKIPNYASISALTIENCDTIDEFDILNKCRGKDAWTVNQVRLIGIDWSFENTDFIKSMYGLKGIDDKGFNTNDAWLVGSCYFAKLTGAEYNEIKAHYPYLDIKYGEMTTEVIFMNADGTEELHRETVVGYNSVAPDCTDPIPDHISSDIFVMASTDKYDFAWSGWSRQESSEIQEIFGQGNNPDIAYAREAQKDALLGITGTRVLYPAFTGTHKAYKVHFVNPSDDGDQVLQTVTTLYGRDAVYTAETPTNLNALNPTLYEFVGWSPKPEQISQELSCYAQFALYDSVWYNINQADITDCYDIFGNPISGYTIKADGKLDITECKNDLNPAVRIPTAIVIDNTSREVNSVAGFASHTGLELVDIQEGITTIGSRAFESCVNLTGATLPDSLQQIQSGAFQGCVKLDTMHIPKGVKIIADAAFAQCSDLETFTVDAENTNFRVEENCLISADNHLIQGTKNTTEIPSTITSMGTYCFANLDLEEAVIPSSVTTVANNAFSRCAQLKKVVLPESIKLLDATSFAWCNNLSEINFPDSLENIMTYVFADCALTDITLPSSIKTINEMAFGNNTALKCVTFKKIVDESGNIIVPTFISDGAFRGASNVLFRVPWSEGDVSEGSVTGALWGAENSIIRYNYEEEADV